MEMTQQETGAPGAGFGMAQEGMDPMDPNMQPAGFGMVEEGMVPMDPNMQPAGFGMAQEGMDPMDPNMQGVPDIQAPSGGAGEVVPDPRDPKGNALWLQHMPHADGEKWQLTPNYAIHRLRKMLAEGFTYGLPGTKGSIYLALIMLMKQEHSLLAIHYGHPLHPFSRNERVLFLFICLCWVFFVSVETDYLGDAVGVLVTLVLVVPFKKFVRLILECPCLYAKGYTFQHEIADDEAKGEENETGVECVAAAAGHGLSIAMCCGSIFLAVIGSLRAQSLNFSDFFVKWLFSQAVSLTISEPLVMIAMAIFHIYCYPGEIRRFERKWSAHFHHIGAPTPHSMSDIGLRAKFAFVKICGVTEFYTRYPDYDSWFHLGNSENYIRDVERSKGGGYVSSSEAQGGYGDEYDVEMQTENPMFRRNSLRAGIGMAPLPVMGGRADMMAPTFEETDEVQVVADAESSESEGEVVPETPERRMSMVDRLKSRRQSLTPVGANPASPGDSPWVTKEEPPSSPSRPKSAAPPIDNAEIDTGTSSTEVLGEGEDLGARHSQKHSYRASVKEKKEKKTDEEGHHHHRHDHERRASKSERRASKSERRESKSERRASKSVKKDKHHELL